MTAGRPPHNASGDQMLRNILEQLLRRGEVEKDRQRDITLPATRIAGYPFRNAEKAKDFHAGLKYAEEQGAVRVEWCKHHEGHELARLRLLDARTLAEFLRVEYLPDRVDAIFTDLESDRLPVWCKDCLDKIQFAWRKGKTAFGLGIDDSARLGVLVNALNVILYEEMQGTLDYRQFGARYLGDSKATKEIERPLAAMYRQHWDAKAYTDQDVMRALNIVPLAHPVLMRGPMKVGTSVPELSVDINPYLGVSDHWLTVVSLTQCPDYVLTIENLSSFNEYTENVCDGGVVLYTGGFPTRVFQRFYQKVVAQTKAPIYHWGDTDPHGFLILKTLQQQVLDVEIRPHLMDQPDGASYSASKLKELARIAPVNPSVDALLACVIERGMGLIEQEEVAAMPPVISSP